QIFSFDERRRTHVESGVCLAAGGAHCRRGERAAGNMERRQIAELFPAHDPARARPKGRIGNQLAALRGQGRASGGLPVAKKIPPRPQRYSATDAAPSSGRKRSPPLPALAMTLPATATCRTRLCFQ